MKFARLLWVCLLPMALCAAEKNPPGGEARRVEAPEKAAETAGLKWLQALDAGDYALTWKNAAKSFKERVSERKWRSTMRPVREPLGKLTRRTLKAAERTTEIPGAPEADYVVLTFDAAFENKTVATEKLTLINDKDGYWRVITYTVK